MVSHFFTKLWLQPRRGRNRKRRRSPRNQPQAVAQQPQVIFPEFVQENPYFHLSWVESRPEIITPPREQPGDCCWLPALTNTVEAGICLFMPNIPPPPPLLSWQMLLDCNRELAELPQPQEQEEPELPEDQEQEEPQIGPPQIGQRYAGIQAQLAFDFINQNGVSLEEDYPSHFVA